MTATGQASAMRTDGQPPRSFFDGEHVAEDVFFHVTAEAIATLDAARIPYGVMGGLASAVLGRPRWTHDLDFFVRQVDADAAVDALEGAGFVTQRTDPHWLFKAVKRGVLVDLVFKAKGDLYLDDEMIERLVDAEFKGVRMKVLPPEDLIVIKAIIHDEATPRHWHDALSIIADRDLDWDYLLRRARRGSRRVLSLLAYAQSVDIAVPEHAIRALIEGTSP